jgi:hypothetical protein
MRRAAFLVALAALLAGCARDGVRGFYVGGGAGATRSAE